MVQSEGQKNLLSGWEITYAVGFFMLLGSSIQPQSGDKKLFLSWEIIIMSAVMRNLTYLHQYWVSFESQRNDSQFRRHESDTPTS